jgi:hypothetical protein
MKEKYKRMGDGLSFLITEQLQSEDGLLMQAVRAGVIDLPGALAAGVTSSSGMIATPNAGLLIRADPYFSADFKFSYCLQVGASLTMTPGMAKTTTIWYRLHEHGTLVWGSWGMFWF